MILLAATEDDGKAGYCVVETMLLTSAPSVRTFCGRNLVTPEVLQAFSIAEPQLCTKCRHCFEDDSLDGLLRR